MKKSLYLLIIIIGVISYIPQLYAQEANVSAVLDKRTAHVNEEIYLTLRVDGAQGNVSAPHLPTIPGVDTYYTGRTSHITFINNVSTNRVEFSYVLIPRQVGKFLLNSIEVMLEDKRFRTESTEVTVIPGQAAKPSSVRPINPPTTSQSSPAPAQPKMKSPAQQSLQSPQPIQSQNSGAPPQTSSQAVQEPAPAFRPEDDNIFIKAWADKTSVYPNEQIILNYSLYTRYDTRYEGFGDEPEISGFWIEEFPMERDVQRETVRVNGKRYVKADVRKIALFPTSPADYTIKPGTIKVSIRQEPDNKSIFDEFFNDSFFSGSGFFSRRENRILKPEPIQINVRPYPEDGKPADFKGATGNFQITSRVDRQDAKQNEPVNMTMVIEGQGNIETLEQPVLPELGDFKVYESNTSSELFNSGDVVGGRKTFEIVFVPLKAGALTIPSLGFSFFNPLTGKYQTLRTPQYSLNVAPSDKPFEMPRALSQQDMFKKDIQYEGKDIRYIVEKLPEDHSELLRILFLILLIADGLLTFLVLFALWQERVDRIFAKDTALKRRRLARSQAEARIRRLKGRARSKKNEDILDYFEEVDKIMTQYLSDKFNLSAFGTTRADIEKELLAILGEQDPLYRSILEVYQICDESRFGQGDLPTGLKSEALRILQQTISRVERKRR